jgi:hypothetical protein
VICIGPFHFGKGPFRFQSGFGDLVGTEIAMNWKLCAEVDDGPVDVI